MSQSTSESRLKIAVVGLGFGAEFVPIYQAHPNVREVVIVDPDGSRLKDIGDRFGLAGRYSALEECLSDATVDAVHLVTPVMLHGPQSIAVLRAGKHCACTIPMALNKDELRQIVDLQRSAKRNYMMMETAAFTREFLYVQELLRAGRFGRIVFARAHHLQDMQGWPDYWIGFPPLAHITHALGPVLALLRTRACEVHCLGSGTLPPEFRGNYGNPYPVETALFRLAGSDVVTEVTRSMFRMARPYSEAFSLYGDQMGFEWAQVEGEQPLLFEVHDSAKEKPRDIRSMRVDVPDFAHLLPAEIARFTRPVALAGDHHLSFVQGGGHGGSHPHLAHEFVRSIVEGRPSLIDAVAAADWTVAGLIAHESAMQSGSRLAIPAQG